MSDRLREIMTAHGIGQQTLAEELGLHPSTVSHWLRHGRRPKSVDTMTVQTWLECNGVPADEAAAWEGTGEGTGAGTGTGEATPVTGDDDTRNDDGDDTMLLRRQPLHQATRRHFGLTCDPFGRDLASHDDVFECPDIRYVRESMWTTANHGGLLAVVGESGSGKTTLLDDIEDRIARETAPVILVRPDVTGMEASDTRGRVLRVPHIQEAILHALNPDASLRQSPEGRARQLRAALITARESKQAVCVAFDEAHAMPIATLKHLKRLLEIKQGFTRLLSIILLGQPELGIRLSERNPEVREVVQRCEVVTLDPLDDQLEAYLSHKLKAAGRELPDLITPDGLDAIRERLGVANALERAKGGGRPSRAYPLAVGNLVAAALNLAHAAGAPVVKAGAVRGV